MILALFWVHPPQATDSPQKVPIVESPQILWKVQSPQNTVYLAGSIHVLQQHDYPLHQVLDDAFNASSRVMFEMDLDGLSSSLTQMNMLRKRLYLHGESLPTVLSPKSYAHAKANLTEFGLQIEDFHRMKPWMTTTAVMGMELQKIGFDIGGWENNGENILPVESRIKVVQHQLWFDVHIPFLLQISNAFDGHGMRRRLKPSHQFFQGRSE